MSLPTDAVLKSWDQIMKYQVDFSFPLELPTYMAVPAWHSADRVLDLGSGDGYYAKRLAEYFRRKSFSCIDIDDRVIGRGSSQCLGPHQRPVKWENYDIEIEIANVLDYHGNFPVAIARLLVQHLNSPEDLFLAAPNFLMHGGTLFVIDSNDQARLFWPKEKCYQIDAFFKAFSEFQPGRRHSSIMMEAARDFGFDIEMHHMLTIPSSIPTYKRDFYHSYQLFFEIVEEHYGMPFEYDSLRHELQEWANDKGSYSQIGVNVCVYKYVG